MNIKDIEKLISECKRCELHKNRIVPVIDKGNIKSKVVFIGESPGADEQKEGRPFVGKCGKLLNLMLSSIGLKRDDIFIINSVSCRPPDNRNPEEKETLACDLIFTSQLQLIKPAIIVSLGKYATQKVVNSDLPISKLVGKWYKYKDIDVLPTFHPSYLLRNSNAKNETYKHLLMLKEKLNGN